MITFKQFISEDSADFDAEKFEKDCSFILQQMKSIELPSYYADPKMAIPFHGTPTPPKDFEIRTWEGRDAPRDTLVKYHKLANDIFKDEFGIEPRNWMFITGRINQARIYAKQLSNLCVIFPIGKFEWFCSPEIMDFTNFIDSVYMQKQHEQPHAPYETVQKLVDSALADEIKHVEWYHNKNFAVCLQSGNEIMFKCDRYYIIKLTSSIFEKQIFPILQKYTKS